MSVPPDPSAGELRPGDPAGIGRYRLLRRLGVGGMGTVFLADGGQGPVALKVVRPEFGDDPEFRTRFRREVQACFRVKARCTAALLDFDTEAAAPWMAVEYVDGAPLDRLVESAGPMPHDQQIALAVGLAEALVAIHGAGVAHRDLKPGNVLCAPDGPKVIDFGISAAADAASLTSSGVMLGSPGWLAPEQISGGDIGPASDVFAYGLLLAYAASGVPPYGTGPTKAVMFRAMSEAPFVDRTRMVPALAAVVDRATAFDPRSRPTARQLLEELLGLEAQAHGTGGGTVPGVLARDWRVPGHPTAPVGFAGPPATHRYDGPDGYPATRGAHAYAGAGAPARPSNRKWLIPAVIAGVLLVGGGTIAAVTLSGDRSAPTTTVLPTPTAVPPSTSPSASPLAAPAGTYSGTTSQGLPISFVVTADGQVGTVNYDERVTCTERPRSGQPAVPRPADDEGPAGRERRLRHHRAAARADLPHAGGRHRVDLPRQPPPRLQRRRLRRPDPRLGRREVRQQRDPVQRRAVAARLQPDHERV